MLRCAEVNLKSNGFLFSLFLIVLLVATPIVVSAQDQKPTENQAKPKAGQEASGQPQASPEAAKPVDPKNPLTVWVGTGENNSQRSVSYGNGVYRSDDGGKSWKNVGLKTSEHIGRIAIDPKDSNIVYVAAQGPLWGPGRERGLYKTIDGGKTWKQILKISENTGVTDVVIDPQDPDTLYAASYQRRRHMWTLIDGGPESAIYKSTDAGGTWNKLRAGLPATEMGRIGLAGSPVDPNVVYATIEAADRKGGVFRSSDRGGSWEKRNDFDACAMYYSR